MMNGNLFMQTLLLASLTISLVTCSREEIAKEKKALEVKASWADIRETKTVLQEDGARVWWTVGEEINLFYGTLTSGRFVSTNTLPQPTASFVGSLGIIETGPYLFWATYPYNASNTCDGESVTLSLPSGQTAMENTFVDKFFPAVARSNSFNLAFYHVCGGVRFSVKTEGVKRVVFKTAGGEPLAGTVRISYGTDGKPSVKVIDGLDHITVHAPEEGFIPGEYYFAAFLPGTISGLSVLFIREDSYGEKSIRKQLSVNRARFGILDCLDQDAIFQQGFVPDPDIIRFEDPGIKDYLVSAFDTDEDGELSLSEAAAAQSLKNVFGKENSFKTFDEFQYFTGITGIQGTFYNWTQLESILLPESLAAIGASSFYNCTALTDIHIPATPQIIESQAFYKCSNLSTVSFSTPSSIQKIENQAFSSCSNLQDIILPDSLREIEEYAFSNCESLSAIAIPDGVTTMGNGVFSSCKALSYVKLPSSIHSIPSRFFQGCSNLKAFSIPSGITSLGDWAFADSGLQTIQIPGGIYGIGDSVFGRCRELKVVTIEEGVKAIGANAFRECSSLETVVLPKSITSLGGLAFAYCPKLTKMVLFATTPPDLYTSNLPFEQTDSCMFYVPDDVVDLYKTDETWKMYINRILPLSALQ